MDTQGKIIPITTKTERLAVGYANLDLTKQDIYIQEYEAIPDTGIDALAVFHRSKNTEKTAKDSNVFYFPNKQLHLQIKGTQSETNFKSDGTPRRQIEVKHLKVWLIENIPVILTLTDLRKWRENNVITYWICIQTDLDATEKNIIKGKNDDQKHTITFIQDQTLEKFKLQFKYPFHMKYQLDLFNLEKYTRYPHFKEIQDVMERANSRYENLIWYQLKTEYDVANINREQSVFGYRTNIPKPDLAMSPWVEFGAGHNIDPIINETLGAYEMYELNELINRTHAIKRIIEFNDINNFTSLIKNMKSIFFLISKYDFLDSMSLFKIDDQKFNPPLNRKVIYSRDSNLLYRGIYDGIEIKIVDLIGYYDLFKNKSEVLLSKPTFFIFDDIELKFRIKKPVDNYPSRYLTLQFHTRIQSTKVNSTVGIIEEHDYLDMLFYTESEVSGTTEIIYYCDQDL